jgi:exosortase
VEARARTAALAHAAQRSAWPVVAVALTAVAYAPLWRAGLAAPSRYGFETALFRPASMPALPVIAIAAWIAWRRRARLRGLSTPRSPALAAAGFALAASASAWAALTRSAPLLFASAAAVLLAFAAAARGRAGCRVMLLPALVLLIGLAIPDPLEADLVWRLQRWAAAGAADLLRALGTEVELGSAILWIGERQFHVIDGCSGLRGILILSLVALVVRELFARAGAREWLVVLVAPVLGHAINLVRIAWVASGEHPEDLSGFRSDHTPQGIAVLAAGTAALYLLGWGLARTRPAAELPRDARGDAPLPWRAIAAALAALCAISLAVPPFRPAKAPAEITFPESAAGWTSEALRPDPDFIGVLPGGYVHRRYAKTGADGRVRTVELFAADERTPPPATSHLFSAKLAWPGSGWIVQERRRVVADPLDREVELSQAAYASGPEHALEYIWRPRDEGLARESLRSLLALDATPWRRDRPRAVVRLVSPTPNGGPVAYDISKRALDVFVSDFRDALAAL